jgi:putative tryptophan/tyrosine transport system substrate-binding protein
MTIDGRMIGRREFITALGAATAWPFSVWAQQGDLPLVGFLHSATVESYVSDGTGFAAGLKAAGLAEAQDLAIEYRFANGQPDQLPALAADLVRRRVALIVAGGDARAALAAKAATSTIPIVFVLGSDPVRLGLAVSLERPDGNVTGVTFATTGLMAKKLALVRDLVPRATSVGYLAEDPQAYASDSSTAAAIEALKSEILAAAGPLGWPVVVAEVGRGHDYEDAFTMFVERRVSAVVVAPSAVFANDGDEIVAMAAYHGIPTICPRRADVVAGGLMSYGARQGDAWREAGIYVGRILKGAAPAQMPVMQSTRLELVISRGAAKSLGLTVPPTLIGLADEVIE